MLHAGDAAGSWRARPDLRGASADRRLGRVSLSESLSLLITSKAFARRAVRCERRG